MGLTAQEYSDLYYNTMKKYNWYTLAYGTVAIFGSVGIGLAMGKRYGGLTGFVSFVVFGGAAAAGFNSFENLVSENDRKMLNQRFEEMNVQDQTVVASNLDALNERVSGAIAGGIIGGSLSSTATRTSASNTSSRSSRSTSSSRSTPSTPANGLQPWTGPVPPSNGLREWTGPIPPNMTMMGMKPFPFPTAFPTEYRRTQTEVRVGA